MSAPIRCLAPSLLLALALAGTAHAQQAAPTAGQVRTDLYGDPLPPGAVARLGTQRLQDCLAFALSPDGKTVALVGADASIRLCDLATGRELRRFPGPAEEAWHIAYSPDGRTLATGDTASAVCFWDVASGRLTRRLLGHKEYLAALTFAADGKMLATADWAGEVILWDVASGNKLRHLGDKATRVRFSPDGRLLATGGQGSVALWEPSTGKRLRQFATEKDRHTNVAFSPDGKTLVASGSESKVLWRWDTKTGRELPPFAPEKASTVWAAAFAPDGKTIALAVTRGNSSDARLLLCAADSGKTLRIIEDPDARYEPAFTADSRTLVWHTGHAFRSCLRVLDVATGAERLTFPRHQRSISSLAFSPDGRTIASASHERSCRVWDATTGKPLHACTDPEHDISVVAFAPDGRSLAGAGWWKNTIHLWELPNGRPLRSLLWGTSPHDIAFSPDGKTLAATCESMIVLWDPATGKRRLLLEGPEASARLLAFAPEGKTLAARSWDGTLRAYTLRTWELTAASETAPSRIVQRWPAELRCGTGRPQQHDSLTFSPDGKAVVYGVGERFQVDVVDVASGKALEPVKETKVAITSFALSPDGRMLALGCRDGHIRLREMMTGKLRQQLSGHRGEVLPLVFAPDGGRLASGGMDGGILVWNLLAAAKPDTARVPALWDDLASADAMKGFAAVQSLTAVPGQAVALLRERLPPVPRSESERLQRLIADLDAKRFQERERATAELERLGEQAEFALRQALGNSPSEEVRHRLERILAKRAGSPPSAELVRVVRAVEVLELIGNPTARDLLTALAQGAPEARVTREARASLERLARRLRSAP